jgi:hypothetical protein
MSLYCMYPRRQPVLCLHHLVGFTLGPSTLLGVFGFDPLHAPSEHPSMEIRFLPWRTEKSRWSGAPLNSTQTPPTPEMGDGPCLGHASSLRQASHVEVT